MNDTRYNDFEKWTYVLVDSRHPLEWRKEQSDEPRALVLITDSDIPETDSVRGIRVALMKRPDGRKALYFIEEEPGIHPLFKKFTEDLIDYTRNTEPTRGPRAAIARYNLWKNSFKKARIPLNEIQVQGLIGEIIAMRDVLFPRYGQGRTLRAWMNMWHSKQDFMPRDRWYEVKSAIYGSDTVHITSLEQLDRTDDGRLIVVFLGKVSHDYRSGFTLNSLVDEMLSRLDDPEAEELFKSTLDGCGYAWNPEYDKMSYELSGISEYEVRDDFPRIRASELRGRGIVRANYEISLDSMDRFRVS